ncbi:unnamed protein product [Dicrocoelium dendriticum]|nr:unnamed protein product [Dicrocoelium dendriticum]
MACELLLAFPYVSNLRYPCWTCHRDGINAILCKVDKYFLQMKNHRKSRLCAHSAVREMTSEKLQVTGESECLRQ